MRILYDSKKAQFKTPFGCLRENEKCTMSLLVPRNCTTKEVQLCIEDEQGFFLRVPFGKMGEEGEYERFGGVFSLFRRGLYFYYFTVIQEENSFRLFREGYDQTNMEEGEKWQLTCFDENYTTPDEYHGAVMYQIFPDRFAKSGDCDLSEKLTPFTLHQSVEEVPIFSPDEQGIVQNNDFYGGNFKGITEKLDYLLSLGVSVLYLNPIFKAYSNHRYDTADYKCIDPMLGTEEDFIAFCNEAHQRNMKVILDGVFSHTGSDSVYFDVHNRFDNGAFHHGDSPYKDWFQFREYPHSYESWWGIKTLPCVNELNESYLDFIIRDEDSVVAYWMKRGADGFRLDVADELPDEFIRLLHKKVKELNPDGLVIGEVWEDASNKCSYGVRRTYFTEKELDSVMNYPFRDGILEYLTGKTDGLTFAQTVMTICENYPRPVVNCLMNSLSTHDTPRIITLLGDSFAGTKEEKAERSLSFEQKEMALQKERQAAAMQFFLPGMPCIYYGDEAGMEGFEDPLNRRCFPWGREDKKLTEFYCQLILLKKRYPELKKGDTALVFGNEEVFHMSRDNRFHLIVNRNGEPYSVDGTLLFGQNAEQTDSVTVFSGGFALVKK
ncbi:MAG: glycoside hydrolase family 13 protein [Ruminococcaceae bacterium]|nr:glycoside hydrolase family 13 protein [Oscillospiraceae bacterium]